MWFGRETWPLLAAISILLLISYLLFPLLDGIILGTVFAYVGRPVRGLFGKRRGLGSLAATVCIVIPLFAIVGLGAMEIVSQLSWLEEHQEEILGSSTAFVKDLPLPKIVYDELAAGVRSILGMAPALAASLPVLDLGRALSLGTINLIISLPVCYFLLLDGWLVELLRALLPPDEVELYRGYFSRIDKILSGIYLGSIYTAVAGGITSIAIFYFFGIPRPFAMACIVFLAGMVPFLTWLVFIPTSLFRYLTFGLVDALVFFAVGSILVHLVELIIRPYFVSAKSSLHPLLVLLTFMGGGLVAGIGGFFLAPALAGVVVGVYQVMREEIEAEKMDGADGEEDDAPGSIIPREGNQIRPPQNR
jgi:predicted PurR-regulated permease PerM